MLENTFYLPPIPIAAHPVPVTFGSFIADLRIPCKTENLRLK